MRFKSRRNPAGEPTLEVIPSRAEFDILVWLPQQIRSLFLDPEASKPYLDKLFPPASRHDAAVAAEYRRLLGASLFEERRQAIEHFAETTKRVPLLLAASEIELWLQIINDVRLILGVRLGIEDEEFWDVGPASESDRPTFDLACWLGHLQSVLLDHLAGK